jgi:hypothetical protein
LYSFLISLIHATYTVHITFLEVIALIIFIKAYELWDALLRIFIQLPITFSHLGRKKERNKINDIYKVIQRIYTGPDIISARRNLTVAMLEYVTKCVTRRYLETESWLYTCWIFDLYVQIHLNGPLLGHDEYQGLIDLQDEERM